jgi:uncharacterized membrane protein YheB (UPF0754 family)
VLTIASIHFGIKEISIPFFTGVIGYITNWTAVLMLFKPLEYRGVRVPGLRPLIPFLPKKVLLVPMGLSDARFGWQGIIPSRAAKMGSIMVDKGLGLLGTPRDFYEELEPKKIAAQIIDTSQPEMRELVERIMVRHHPEIWGRLPAPMKELVHERVQAQIPGIVNQITDDIGENIDQLLDIKMLVIRKLEERPELANEVFWQLGRKELIMIQNLGFVFGFLQGVPLMFLTMFYTPWWPIPFIGILIGFITNKVALDMIFEPIEPRYLFGIKIHGLFLRRQHEIAEIYSEIIAREVVTVGNLGEELLVGPRSDRTRRMIEDRLRPIVDRAIGPFRLAAMTALPDYGQMRAEAASEAVAFAVSPLSDPEFNKRQSERIGAMLTAKVRLLGYKDFSEMLRTAIHDDEWLVLAHGGALGLLAGLAHVTLFNILKIAG